MAGPSIDAGALGTTGPSATRLRGYRYGFALAVVLTLLLLLLPGDAVLAVKVWVASWLPYAHEVDQADWTANADKLQHASLFAVLGALGCRAWQQRHERLRVFAGVLLLGAGTELLQSLVPGRECSAWDFAADALGLLGGWWLVRATLRGLHMKTETGNA